MGLAEEIRAIQQTIIVEVRIAGQLVPGVLEVRASHGFDQVNSQATIICATKPALAEERTPCEVRAGYNGATALIFRGELSGKTWRYSPTAVALDARSVLWRVGLKWAGEDRVYTSQDDAAIIRNLLEAYGIPNTEANIESSGWTLGEIQDVILAKGDQALSLIEEIDKLAGYRTFTISTGVVLRRRISTLPGASPMWAFTKGVDLFECARIRTEDGMTNHVIIEGVAWEDVEVRGEASASNPYIPDPPGEAAEQIQSDLVETNEKALEIAGRMLGDRNRRPERLELTTVGNPLIQPAATIQVFHDELDVSGALVLAEHVEHTINAQGFTTTIRTTGGNLSGYEEGAPIAQFDLKLFLEGLDTGTSVEQLIVGIADGSTSFDPDGPPGALSYAWTITPDAGTATPSSGAGPLLRFTITGAVTSLTVTLTVTDGDGLSSTSEQTVPVVADELPVEDLSSAEGTLMRFSEDGQRTWNEATVPGGALTTCLAAFAPAWGQVWGCSDGHLYATWDALKTAPIDLGAPHGAVAATAVWVHETDQTRVWAAFADGHMAFGTLDLDAHTCVWELRGTVPSPVNEIRESYGAFGELRATAGESEYYSTDAGASWVAGVAGASGSTAWRMAAGFDTNAVALLTDSSPVRYEVGGAPTFPTLSPAVTSIRALSFGYRARELYAADDQNPARLFRSDEAFATFSEVGTAAGLASWNHMIRSGNEDGVVYAAAGDGSDEGGVIKSIRLEEPWYVARSGSRKVYMVGYGAAHLPRVVVAAGLILPTYNLSGADDGVWVHTGTAWDHRSVGGSGGLPTAGLWVGCVTHPTNRGVWMLWSTSAAYLTTDAGASWTDVGVNTPSGAYAGWGIRSITFTTASTNDWVAVGEGFDGWVFALWRYFWRGTGASVSASSASTVTQGHDSHLCNIVARLLTGAAFGCSFSWRDTNGGQTFTFGTSGATPTGIGSETIHSLYTDRLPDSPAGVGVVIESMEDSNPPDQGQLWYSANAGTTEFTLHLATALGRTICAAVDACYVGTRIPAFGGDPDSGGIIRIDGVGTSPVASIAYAAGNIVGIIRSDRQTQRTVAARRMTAVSFGVPDSSVYVYDGTTWATVAGPSGVSGTNLSAWVEPATNL